MQDNQKQGVDYESETERLRLRLLYRHGKAKEHVDAEEMYGEIIENYKEATPPEPEADDVATPVHDDIERVPMLGRRVVLSWIPYVLSWIIYTLVR